MSAFEEKPSTIVDRSDAEERTIAADNTDTDDRAVNADITDTDEKPAQIVNQDPESGDVDPAGPRAGMANWRWVTIMMGICFGGMLYGLDTTIAADVQASVYETLGDIQNLSWVGLGFPMASVAMILFLGRILGLFNIKVIFIASFAVFEIGSAVCGAAPSSAALIVGRVIAGMGGAGMYLGGLSYISVFTTHREANLYNALIGLSWGVGAILGPVIGGAFSDSSATWRWAFYINLPLAALLAPIYIFLYPSYNPRPDLTHREKIRSIDWVGVVLNGAIFVLFTIVVTFGGSTYPWKSGAAIALWVVWGVSLIAFIVQQAFSIFTTPENRIFPVHFLKNPTLVLLYLATAGCSASNGVTLYYIPLYFQFTNGDSALDAAVRLLPFIILFIFFLMFAGGLMPTLGRYNVFYIFGGALILAGGSAFFAMGDSASTAQIYGYEILLAAGSGLTFQNAYAVVAAKVKPEDRPNAIGFINTAQIGTTAIALAIAGSLFQNLGFESLKEAFAGDGFPDDYIRSALAGSISPIFASADPAIVQVAIQAVSHTIRRVFGTVIAAGALIVVSGLAMRWEKIDLDVVAGG